MRSIRPPIVAAGLVAVVAAVALATPASGVSTGKLSKQIKQLKKQVASIQKQQGPAGAAGAAGTARAYATVSPNCTGSPPEVCTFGKAKGITSVLRTGVNYCITAPGIDPATTSAAVSVDWDNTSSPEENGQVFTGGVPPDCGGFKVRTERIGPDPDNTVAFTIVIP